MSIRRLPDQVPAERSSLARRRAPIGRPADLEVESHIGHLADGASARVDAPGRLV
jgi:hypothetical protein